MENKKTCLYDKHVALGALISPFGGFEMPIQYTNIVDEHQAVRQACGVFDVSHMGEVLISGPDAERYVNHIFTNDVREMPVGKILYGMMCYGNGGVVDDLLVYKMDTDCFFLVINASNIAKDWVWIQEQAKGYEVVGVSKDSAASHQKFKEKHSLPFPLIADVDKTLLEAMGAWGEKTMYGKKTMGTIRTTFIINGEGVIEQIFSGKQVNTKEHATQILSGMK